jgi:hypothetical protein
MTSHVLYEIYRGAYAESSHFESAMPVAPRGLARRLREFLWVERTIVELGRHDATNGRPMRTPGEFERALAQGRVVLPGMAPAGT